jgi:hypothetical protein
VKVCSAKVVECAEFLSSNPRDTVAQQKLTAAQKDLGNAIQKVVDLTHTGDSDIVDAMAQMKLESSSAVGDANLMQSAQQVCRKL